MSEAKFTKGEWEVSSDGLSVGVGGFKVARAFSGCATPYFLETTKNAHLIAAAPEMYEMLEKSLNEIYILVGKVNEKNAGFTNYDDMHMVREIKFLIAKARGEHD